MATNEINKHGEWLTLPVNESARSGDPVVFGGKPGVVHVIYQDERAEMEGYVARPVMVGGNASGSDIDQTLLPDSSVFASVALKGVWAFSVDEDDDTVLEIGTAVYYDASGNSGRGTVVTTSTDNDAYGLVVNRGTDGRHHVLLTTDLGV